MTPLFWGFEERTNENITCLMAKSVRFNYNIVLMNFVFGDQENQDHYLFILFLCSYAHMNFIVLEANMSIPGSTIFATIEYVMVYILKFLKVPF
uniref:Uncharacterized protein n=1 Tax=Globisporangium ultimum (strain ATCC 200006 / CBS 805.95 / DAOM BR144) TaxID=431595 RepID=K3XCJ4_GLOUD